MFIFRLKYLHYPLYQSYLIWLLGIYILKVVVFILQYGTSLILVNLVPPLEPKYWITWLHWTNISNSMEYMVSLMFKVNMEKFMVYISEGSWRLLLLEIISFIYLLMIVHPSIFRVHSHWRPLVPVQWQHK